ncbi:MAG: nodulation protein NfeD [Chloroflexi bacterium]|nr:nodulation protein NfeD [Chloroflexota bacterium]
MPKKLLSPALLRLFFFALCLLLGLAGAASAQGRHILLLDVDGVIGPTTEKYIARGVKQAEAEGAELLVVRLDTPGGLLDSTRKIVEHLLNTNVPTAVYVTPRGAYAASAGTFITASANFAAMAPGTNIGAATPVSGSGEDLPKTLSSKATNDAAALMRSIAQERGRNAEKLEATVREAASFSAEEAVSLDIVDLIAADLDGLLDQVDGRTATTPAGAVVVRTKGLPIRTLDSSLVEQFVGFLADPNVAFLLFSLGSLGLVAELLNPGLIFPGVIGAILLLLAFVGLGNLPVNWAGVALLVLAVVLFVLEFYVSGFGILGIGAAVSFVLGALFLFYHAGGPSPAMPDVRVSLWLLAPVTALLIGGGAWVMFTIVRSRRALSPAPSEPIVGATGYVTSDLNPRGTVMLRNELWSAVGQGHEVIRTGQEIRVVEISGTLLTVTPVTEASPAAPSEGGAQRPHE